MDATQRFILARCRMLTDKTGKTVIPHHILRAYLDTLGFRPVLRASTTITITRDGWFANATHKERMVADGMVKEAIGSRDFTVRVEGEKW